jgi:hypothetical protein
MNTRSSGTVLVGVKGALRRARRTAVVPALDPACAPCNMTWSGTRPSPGAGEDSLTQTEVR